MAYNFIPCDRDQTFLMPPSLHDWIGEDHPAWFVVDAVSEMDLSAFYAKYRSDGWGAAAFTPDMMVSLLLYAYCTGVRSSRKIEKLCETDVAFKIVAANKKPDHATIARFRRKNLKELEALFTQILRLCAEAGLVKVGVVAIDGTKMEANAALAANRTHEAIEKEIKREVTKMLAEAETVDREEDGRHGKKRGDELPEELRVRKTRVARLRECKARLEREAEERAASQQKKIDERAAKEEASGKKLRGRKPKEPDATPSEKAKANVTEPESRIMKTRKGYVQGYNAQAAVTEEQIIVAAEVTQEANDVKQLHSTIEKAAENLQGAGVEERVGTALADAGYWSEANVQEAEADGPELLIATTKDWKQRKAARERPPPRGRIPKDISCREQMERKLMTRRGRALYKKRSRTVEPVFGQIKDARGSDRFLLRGIEGVSCEWKLLCGTHNLLKLWRSGRASWN
ncbi:MAG: IS1182 family transposase [Planctomycetota bacterium]